jgi:hypothetical protein
MHFDLAARSLPPAQTAHFFGFMTLFMQLVDERITQAMQNGRAGLRDQIVEHDPAKVLLTEEQPNIEQD